MLATGETPLKDRKKSAKSTSATDTTSERWTDEELAAMKERNRELKASARRGSRADAASQESEALAKIAEMAGSDRANAERIHAIVKASAPALSATTWYGSPAYARDGKIVCFFQPSTKFKTRYSTLGFNDAARLDDGAMWPTAYALTELTAADEARIAELVKKAAG
jgi:uncharacterized protein YdhG (YjbR/CyaY superfamily)